MEFNQNELVKSPLNYTGGKFKLLPQILPLFPDDINTFVDLFAGGCNVGVNIKAEKIICNDLCYQIIQLIKYWSNFSNEQIYNEIKEFITLYNLSDSCVNGYEYYGCNSNDGLSKYNDKQWRQLRADYNTTKDIRLLFPLIIYTFNNSIKFDKENNFIAGGCNKRDFNSNLQRNLKSFQDKLSQKNINFTTKDFRQFDLSGLSSNDFVYIDPPYLLTQATYNTRWGDSEETELLNLINKLHKNNIRFALSNVLEHKGKSNNILKQWSSQYNVHILDYHYGNCNYQTKDKSNNSSIEVLITNYDTNIKKLAS